MQFTDSFATEQRQSILDSFEFFSLCAENLEYLPNSYRPNLDMANHAAEYLHQLMHHAEHQSEY